MTSTRTAPCCSHRVACRGRWRRRTRAAYRPLDPPVIDDGTLVCFLASHTTSAARAEQLGWLLDSVAAQQPHPPPMYVSWSAAADVEHVVRETLERVRWPALQHVHQPKKLTQFEHLRELVRAAQEHAPEWVYFTDDDDLWSEQRHALFARFCRDADTRTTAVVCTRKARPVAVVTSSCIRRSADVRAALASGEARLTDLHALDLNVESFNMDEYFDYAVRFRAFEGFFRRAPSVVIRHKLCDLAFISELRRAQPVRRAPELADEFVYWYSRPEGTPFAIDGTDGGAAGASSSVEIGDFERQLAREHWPEMARTMTGTLAPELFDEPSLAFFFGALRQGIEQELIQMRVVSGSPMRGAFEGACVRQLDLLLADNPLRGTGEGFDRMRAALLALLRGPILQRLMRLLSFDLHRRMVR